jgi:hypothetical protein
MNTRLEQYVEEVRSGLRAMPAERREEEIAELRAHLAALAEAGTTDGLSETEATEAAIRRFGDAHRVRGGLLRAWRRGQPSWLASPLGAVFVALGTHFALGRVLSDPGISRSIVAAFQRFDPAIFTLLLCLPAAAVGALTGYLSPRRAAPATAGVLLLPVLVQHLSALAGGAAFVRFTT